MNMEQLQDIVRAPPVWSENDQEAVLQPYMHLANRPGKNFRAKLIGALNILYGISSEHVSMIEQLISMLHTASLMIDDIEDHSETRRGIITSHLKYGIPMTLNSANYVYFLAMKVLQDLAATKLEDLNLAKDLMFIFNDELINLHRGQGLDIYWTESLPRIIPDEEMYLHMVMNKTGGLFRLAVRMMERVAQYKGPSFVPLCNLLGVVYQIRDDYQNLFDSSMTTNKVFAEDISEGKLSFPILHGMMYERKHGDDGFLRTLAAKNAGMEQKRQIVNYLENVSGSKRYTESTIQSIVRLITEGDFISQDAQVRGHILAVIRALI